MKIFKYLAVIFSVTLITTMSISSVSAEDKEQAVQRFDQACGSDIKEYCSLVQVGDGRISACLYAHTAQLTDSCYAATERVGIILERVFDGIELFFAACSTDLQEFCPDTQTGTGAPLACLREKLAEISPGCVAALPDDR
jgi:hypothetical protein